MDPKEILAKRATVWSAMRAIVDAAKSEDRAISGEEREKYERAETELNELTAQYDLAVRDAEHARLMAEARGGSLELPPSGRGAGDEQKDERTAAERYSEAYFAWARQLQGDVLPREQAEILSTRSMDPEIQKELRAQGVATGGAGGYTVPPDFLRKITETQKFFSSLIGIANVVDTDSGVTLPWPGNDDTGNVGAILAENTQISEQDVTFTQKDLEAYVYTSKLVRVSWQLLNDSAFDVEAFLARKFGERLGRIHNQHFTTGTGTAQPQGIVTGTTVGKTAASATVIDWAEFVDLIHSVDIAYRSSGRARFMLNDLVLAAVRKLEDLDGRPLWQPSIQVGQPDSLLGYPVEVNNDMASTLAAGNVVALFGDFFQGYVIRRVKGITTIRLNERYADYLQTGFFAYDRVDGVVDDAAAVKQLKMAAS